MSANNNNLSTNCGDMGKASLLGLSTVMKMLVRAGVFVDNFWRNPSLYGDKQTLRTYLKKKKDQKGNQLLKKYEHRLVTSIVSKSVWTKGYDWLMENGLGPEMVSLINGGKQLVYTITTPDNEYYVADLFGQKFNNRPPVPTVIAHLRDFLKRLFGKIVVPDHEEESRNFRKPMNYSESIAFAQKVGDGFNYTVADKPLDLFNAMCSVFGLAFGGKINHALFARLGFFPHSDKATECNDNRYETQRRLSKLASGNFAGALWADANSSGNSLECLKKFFNAARERKRRGDVEMMCSTSAFAFRKQFFPHTHDPTKKLSGLMGQSVPLPESWFPAVDPASCQEVKDEAEDEDEEMEGLSENFCPPGLKRCSSNDSSVLFAPERKDDTSLNLDSNGHRFIYAVKKKCRTDTEFSGEMFSISTLHMSHEYAERANRPCDHADRVKMMELNPFSWLALWILFDGEFTVLLGDGSDKVTLGQLFDGPHGFGTLRIGGLFQAVKMAEHLARLEEEEEEEGPPKKKCKFHDTVDRSIVNMDYEWTNSQKKRRKNE